MVLEREIVAIHVFGKKPFGDEDLRHHVYVVYYREFS